MTTTDNLPQPDPNSSRAISQTEPTQSVSLSPPAPQASMGPHDHPATGSPPPGSTNRLTPTDHQLRDAILAIRADAPVLGVAKLLIKLKELNPEWLLSEKRLRKFVNSDQVPRPNNSEKDLSDLSAASRPPSEPLWLPNYVWEKDWEAADAENSPREPVSSLDDTLLLECRQRSVKIEPVRFPASNKGSGLIAKDDIRRGTQIMKEDAYVWVPPTKNMSRSVMSGQSCAFCGRAFSMQRTKSQPHCPHHPAPGSKEAIAAQQLVVTTSTSLTTGGQSVTEKLAGPEPCYMRYCTRVCAQRSVDYYGPLVCPQRNPEYMQLVRYTDTEEFRGAHMVFKLFARMLIANESGDIAPNPSFNPSPKESSAGYGTTPQNGETNGTHDHVENEEKKPSGEPLSTGVKKVKKPKAKKKSLTNSAQSVPCMGTSIKFEEVLNRINGLATISDRARREKYHGGGHLGSHFADIRYGQMWRNGWQAVIKALHINTGYRPISSDPNSPPSPTDLFWNSFWRRRLDPAIISHYFGLKSFLEYIGKASLNREADHGLYLLHSRFNHSCEPNAVASKHPGPGTEEVLKSSPSTIYVMSRKNISKDEEITLSYINPDLNLEARRRKLFEDYLFSCFCSRCRQELNEEEERRHYMQMMEKTNESFPKPTYSENKSENNNYAGGEDKGEGSDQDMSFSLF